MKRLGRYLVYLFVFSAYMAQGQPLLQSKRLIEGIQVYRDASRPFLYYYEPGKITLSHDEKNSPDFQFVDMRYTGSACYDDAGAKNFTSLIQFGVELEPIPGETLKSIKNALGNSRSVTLKPLSVSHIHTRLIIPNTKEDTLPHKIAEDNGSLEANDEKGNSPAGSYWRKRTYTVRLSPYESQLLNNQLSNGLLGITLSYSFYANFLNREKSLAGSRELKGRIDGDTGERELQKKVFLSNSLPIQIDIDKYPGAIKQLDLNEEIPPAYAALEIRCYDFRDDLRPDLYLKTVEIEAESVNGQKIKGIEARFSANQSDLATVHIRFPYAVSMSSPMRYRIKETEKNGTSVIHDWITKPECSSVIDITSAVAEQTLVPFDLDIEIAGDYFSKTGSNALSVILSYQNNDRTITEEVNFDSTSNVHFQSVTFKKDKDTPVYYQIQGASGEDSPEIPEKTELEDHYLYVQF